MKRVIITCILLGGIMLNSAKADIKFHKLEGQLIALISQKDNVLLSEAIAAYIDNPVLEESLIRYCEQNEDENDQDIVFLNTLLSYL